MQPDLTILVGSAGTIGLVHTLLGPDHYLPFAAMGRARGWTLRRTLWITGFCGLGHVLGSVVLGAVGIAAGITLRHLEVFESRRGEVAGWLLMAFGLAYLAWSVVRLLRGRVHVHAHHHADGTAHSHPHDHHGDHAHPHAHARHGLVPWSLFVIFVLGPCEPLIPLLMFPAATLSPGAVVLVAAVFGLVTIGTMLTMVTISCLGMRSLWTGSLHRFGQPAAGALVFLCGLAIQLGF
jgi:hypothetical protein